MKKVLTLKKILTFVLAVFMFVPALAFTGCIQQNLEDNTSVTKPKYLISVASASSVAGTVAGSGTFEEGTKITIRAIANSDYKFYRWGDGNTDNPRTVTVTSSKSYMAYFNFCGDCNISAKVVSIKQGVVTNSEVYGYVEGTGTHQASTTITLKAVPEEGCLFIKWKDGCFDAEREVDVKSDASYTAYFVKADAIYVHEKTGYYAAVSGECEVIVSNASATFKPLDIKNVEGWCRGTNDMIFYTRNYSISLYFADFTRDFYFTLMRTRIGCVGVLNPNSQTILNNKSGEGDWTYLSDLEKYVEEEGFTIIYLTDFKITEPSTITTTKTYDLYIYKLSASQYRYFAVYSVYQTSKGVCVDMKSRGYFYSTSLEYGPDYYRGEERLKMVLAGVS